MYIINDFDLYSYGRSALFRNKEELRPTAYYGNKSLDKSRAIFTLSIMIEDILFTIIKMLLYVMK